VLPSAVAQIARPARMRPRHYAILLSFLLLVLVPSAAAFWYLYAVAHDQYSSKVSFSIRSEEFQNPLDAIGSLGQISTGTSSDASILNEYIRSQKLLEDIGETLDLRALYSKPDFDPVFAFDPDQPIEDLLTYWRRMTAVAYDPGTGLIDIEVFAFTARDATRIATAVMEASSALVDELSNIARDDTTRHAKYELERAQERLTRARLELRQLRDTKQVIDPSIDLESQMGVLTALQTQLATAMIEYDLLLGTTRESDPRLDALGRRIEAIEARIADERDNLGQDSSEGREALAGVIGQFETLLADRQFAEEAYVAAAASYDTALAEARRKSRYLAAHIPPTRAESAQYPSRGLLGTGVFVSLLLAWMIGLLTVYALMDRR
jgi:capsular polysaccharide transport system permease protein